MNHALHITRKTDRLGEIGPKISLEEWLAWVDGDPEMKRETGAEAPTGDRRKTVRTESPGTASWTRLSEDGVARTHAWFTYDGGSGSVTAASSDRDIRTKMLSIAAALKAQVQGDDGETFGPAEVKAHLEVVAKKSWWKPW